MGVKEREVSGPQKWAWQWAYTGVVVAGVDELLNILLIFVACWSDFPRVLSRNAVERWPWRRRWNGRSTPRRKLVVRLFVVYYMEEALRRSGARLELLLGLESGTRRDSDQWTNFPRQRITTQ